jgi:hypothetical protein
VSALCAAARLLAASRATETFQPTYLGIAVLAVLLALCLIKAYGLWQEMHDVEEPASPGELLQSFERAYYAGEMDADEFERVRSRLTGLKAAAKLESRELSPEQAATPEAHRSVTAGAKAPQTSLPVSGRDVTPENHPSCSGGADAPSAGGSRRDALDRPTEEKS